jgi:hypothetical protein
VNGPRRPEHWKRTFWVGVAFAAAILYNYVFRYGDEPSGAMIGAMLGCFFGAGAWQVGKRYTEWKPTEVAEAKVIEQNGGGSEAARRRAEDEYDAEFAG